MIKIYKGYINLIKVFCMIRKTDKSPNAFLVFLLHEFKKSAIRHHRSTRCLFFYFRLKYQVISMIHSTETVGTLCQCNSTKLIVTSRTFSNFLKFHHFKYLCFPYMFIKIQIQFHRSTFRHHFYPCRRYNVEVCI